MKKHLSIFLFLVLAFILLGSSVDSIYAYDAGCTSAGPYSIITGLPCYGVQNNYSNTYSNQQFQLGARGSEVVALQQMLANAGFYTGRIDGIYGSMTDNAFINYRLQYPSYSNTFNYPNSYPYNKAYPYYNQAPVISGVSGSQSISVNQLGTWTVNASNSGGGTLSYSVNWGDQPIYAYGTTTAAPIYLSQQSATFTHVYYQSGTFTPVFTVTNQNGQIAQTSLTIYVSGGITTNYISPTITSMTPTSGPVGTQITIYGSGFNANNCASSYYSSACLQNTINFGGAIIQNVYSSNGTSLTFSIPAYTNSACLYSTPACVIPQYQIMSGIYPVFVTNANGISNVINFTVTYPLR